MAAAATLVLGALAGSLNGLLITLRADPGLDRDPRLVLAVPRPGRGVDRRRGQLHQLPGLVPVPGPGLFAGRDPDPGADLRGGGGGVLGAAAPDTIGRGLSAIGFSPEGARYAGLPVDRLVGLVYVLSGLVASLAAIIYVAHLGQAKADAGTGYELAAITAVVLGGTSIFGGRGSVPGTLLGLLAIAVLRNGMLLADLPAELAGVLTGILAPGGDRAGPSRPAVGAPRTVRAVRSILGGDDREEFASRRDLRRDPGRGLINAVGNFVLVRSLQSAAGRDARTELQPARRAPRASSLRR